MKDLKEEDFIQEGYRKNRYPFWFWAIGLTILAALVWYFSIRQVEKVNEFKASRDFLRVTNRQFSLFLWQNPEFMRINAKRKSGYLPAFQYLGEVTVEPELADGWVTAPNEVLFRYHIWNLLLGYAYFSRPIPQQEFLEFLKQDPQWEPKYWKDAPDEYKELLQLIEGGNTFENLNLLNTREMPMMVRKAFQGWKNYKLEGESVNAVEPSYSELNFFLAENPNYSRSHWKNILSDTQPNYLLSEGMRGSAKVPRDQLSPFLKAGLYNFLQSGRY